ncbi:FAD-dependent monooxygenase [Pararhodobacter zhoushanensis]|uniref:FAD-dependent monooxygenase n=1 Tax=Pararhodobacter zhoushanensis TaxID=2479545 RepID=UPI000F8DB9FA|nr:FAD-dependent monooxygenase [Pararhodobacter zhoushanensis]
MTPTSPHAQIFDVVINGGGPVGMGLAIELGLRGVSVCVVERHATPQPIPKGQNLTQRTVEHFHFWGCEQALHEAHPIPKDSGIGGITCYGSLTGEYQHDWLERSKLRDFYYSRNARLPQYATEAVLRARAAQIDTITLRYGWTGTGVEQDADSATLHIEKKDGPGRDSVRGRYLVGCDGSHSMVRQAAGITQTQQEHRKLMSLVVFTSEELDALLKRYPGKAFYNVLNPKYDGYWLFFGRVDHGTSWFFHAPVPLGTTADNFDFPAFLHEAAGVPFDLSIDHVGFWDLRFTLADQYRQGRVFLAGDAAHSHPPYGGFGINSGLEDSVNLGWKLAAMVQGWGTEALLDSYHTERHGVFASTIEDFIAKYIREDRSFLSTYAPDQDRAAFEKAWQARSEDDSDVRLFAPNYAGSPVVGVSAGAPSATGGHEVAARVGHHLTPQVLADGCNVFEALGAGYTLLALKGAAEAQVTALAHAAKAAGVPLTVVRDTGTAAEAYGAPLVLVRPDQFVAWAGTSIDAQPLMQRLRGA